MTTTTANHLADPLALLRGMPFLDDAFNWKRLLAAAAAVRHVEAEHEGATGKVTSRNTEAWLTPARVHVLRNSPPMPAAPLTSTCRAMVDVELQAAAATIPAWDPLIQLPVRYALLTPDKGAISASSRAFPQHVLLAEAAFESGPVLREQLVHELAHQWLYMIQEVWALERAGAEPVTLPSGTSGRSPSEVLGAAHVAATLIRMYRTGGGAPPSRIDALSAYGIGCLNLLTALTDTGLQIARRLKEAL
ncbi:aKG-HExxH-type peptide beta-hydroxylase [Actinomadura sp. HBU206391]|uniref:aKG-HExxH-type peptide beta-hydroxylase n=1 Tax=Actinomadura sp. HBU206391 TaxID=2731692 RepID=UPI00164FEF22|nr:HEXXH motif-containing putative peptide modification protein [Actinomadura sp. HBU206391]MBC6457093.1 TetR family transcriptional regulator [Actinomadura sp. HBU206391]